MLAALDGMDLTATSGVGYSVEEAQPLVGVTYFDDRNLQRVERRLVRRLERMGYVVSLEPPPSPQPAA